MNTPEDIWIPASREGAWVRFRFVGSTEELVETAKDACALSWLPPSVSLPVGFILCVETKEERRRTGLASKALREAEERLAKKGASFVFVRMGYEESEDEILSWYEKRGYSRVAGPLLSKRLSAF